MIQSINQSKPGWVITASLPEFHQMESIWQDASYTLWTRDECSATTVRTCCHLSLMWWTTTKSCQSSLTYCICEPHPSSDLITSPNKFHSPGLSMWSSMKLAVKTIVVEGEDMVNNRDVLNAGVPMWAARWACVKRDHLCFWFKRSCSLCTNKQGHTLFATKFVL